MFTHPEVLSVYQRVLLLIKSTKNDLVPFNANVITKLLVTFEEHLKTIKPVTLCPPDFTNMLYTLVEEQATKGFIISEDLKQEIDSYRKTMDKTPMNLNLQKFLIHSAKFG